MKRSVILIATFAIIAGIIVIITAGFNLDIQTKAHERIQVNIGEEFENKDVKQLVSEVLDGQVEVQKTGDFEDQAIISASEISEEQINEIVTKINEKYETELEADGIEVVSVPATKLTDILTPYIWSFVVATILILVYLSIRYKKQGSLKVIGKTLACLAIVELLVFSLIALVRIPVGQNLASIIFVTYVVAVFATTIYFENKLQKEKMENQKS